MPVHPHEAEEYELPPLRASTSSNLGDYDEDDDKRGEVDRLLDSQRERKRATGSAEGDGDEDEDDDDALLDELENRFAAERRLEGDEVVGKGTNVEQLIARTVPSTDDPSLPTLTIRVFILGAMFCLMGATASQIFYFKSNAPTFSSYFIILATYPLGHTMANERLIPRGKRVLGVNLNPGPFSIKEAILISVFASSGGSSAYAADILAIMDLYFHMPISPIPSIVLLLTTQCIGFGLAGLLQNLLVTPPAMYWPSILVVVQLFTTLYSHSSSLLSRAQALATRDRLRVFMLIFIAAYLYQFLPFLLFPTLTSLSVLCLANNGSWWMRTLGSGYNGLGFLNLSFDWSSVGSSGPLYTPYWALGNYFGGLIGMCWLITPILLAMNFWNAREFPSAVSAGLFNSTYKKFDVSAVLNPDLSLNEEAWEQAKPLLLTPYFAISYALSFAALSSVLVHVWLWHREEIRTALSNRVSQMSDVHNKLMRNYASVPSSWYLVLLAVNFGAAVVMVKTTPLQMPIWALVLAMAIATVFLVPVGIIAAVSNTTIGLNVLTEFVAGVLMPGKPIGNVTFKCFGYMAMSQALSLTADLKLGWYTSIPPREMFTCQIMGTVLGCLANYVTLRSVITEKRPYLDGTTIDPTGQWTGRSPGIFYSASIIWGAVAPRRFFSGGYEVLYLGFVVGAIVPVGCWFAHKRWPRRKFNKVVFPIICSGATLVPQYPTNIILTSAAVAVAANSWFAKQYPKTHGKYVYVVSSALDAGTSITALTIYVLFNVLSTWDGPRWWGNPALDSEHCTPGS